MSDKQIKSLVVSMVEESHDKKDQKKESVPRILCRVCGIELTCVRWYRLCKNCEFAGGKIHE